jgi:hypothetical protein
MTVDTDAAVTELRAVCGDAVRLVATYDGDDTDLLYRREDAEDEFSEEEFEETLNNAVLKALDDAREQPEFSRWGHLDATVRWFHDVVALQVPTDDWTGVLITIDRAGIPPGEDIVETVLTAIETGDDDGDPEAAAEKRIEEEFGGQ